MNPSYDVVKKIFEYLEHVEQPHTGLAKDIEKRDVVWLKKNERIRDAAEKMRQYGFSQLPIRDEKEEMCIGSISERQIVQSLLKEPDPKSFYDKLVADVMEEQFPVVDETMPASAVAMLLQHSQAILTARKGKIVGIITPTDLLAASAGSRAARKYSASDGPVSS